VDQAKGLNAFWFRKAWTGISCKILQNIDRGNFYAADVLTIITEPFPAFIGD
jgi:hypothetical protein